MNNGLNEGQKTSKKLALAHDFLIVWGGAERVFKVMTEMYPRAPIYTLFYDGAFVRKYFPGRVVRASFLQHWPQWLRQSGMGKLFYPVAVETLDLRDFDTVLSSSGAWMKGLVTRLHTRHIAYLHSPMRYVWDTFHEHPKLTTGFKFWKRLLLSYLRLWDKEAAARPDVVMVNSDYTLRRVAKYYGREASRIYPPVGLAGTVATEATERTYFLVVARLSLGKHIELAVRAFNKLGLPLMIVGVGEEEKKLRALAEKHITFVGAISDEKLHKLYGSARALIQPSEEDFGLAAVEAWLHETPVIAYRAGAIMELMEPGKMGELFDDLVAESLADGVRRFIEREDHYDRDAMRSFAQSFSRSRFEEALRLNVD